MPDELNDALRDIANPLVEPITGYFITITDQNTEAGDVIHESELKLSRVGGAHVRGVADLIMLIEDAVFKQEESK